MAFTQVIAIFYSLIDVIGLPGNLMVFVTIALISRLHKMRYILLASLALSDILFLILVNSFRIPSIAQERWLHGEFMCYFNSSLGKYFYLNTVLHLVAMSYDRYSAIVKSPLTYNGLITKSKIVVLVLIWVAPISGGIGLIFGGEKHTYNPAVFYCEQESLAPSASSRLRTIIFTVLLTMLFFSVAYFNGAVYKTAKTKIHALQVQIGGHDDPAETAENKKREMTRSLNERKAAIDVIIIITAFFLCYLPTLALSLFRRFIKSNVSAEVVHVTTCIFMASTVCNPLIYSIRKRDFRAGVKDLLRRFVPYGRSNDNEVTVISLRATVGRENSNLVVEELYPQQRVSLSPIPELIVGDINKDNIGST